MSNSPKTLQGEKWIGWKIILLILAPFAICALLLNIPDDTRLKATHTRWELKKCALLGQDGEEYLLVHAESFGRIKSPTFTWIATLNIQDGKVLGEYVISSSLQNLGLEGERIWLREQDPGSFINPRDFALVLPKLQVAPEVDLPHISARSQLGFVNYDPPAPPRMLKGELVLDGCFVCDQRTGRPIDLENRNRLLAHQTLQDSQGKLILTLVLTRLNQKTEPLWRLAEKQIVGKRDFNQPGFRVAWATKTKAGILLVLHEAENEGALYIVCLDPLTGQLTWKHSAP